MPGFGVGGGGFRGHDEVYDAQGGGIFPIDWGIFHPVSFELPGEMLVQADMSLGVEGGGVWGRIGHPVGGTLKLPPMSEKPIIFQVVPLGAWTTGLNGPGTCRLGGF